jgi:hypothetical protein
VQAQKITREGFGAKVAEIERHWQHFVKIELTLNNLDPAKDAAAQRVLRGADAVHFAALQSLQQRLSGSDHQ